MDDFTPTAPTEQSDELKANIELAKAAVDPAFLAFVQKQIFWDQNRPNTPDRIPDDETEKNMVGLFDEMKQALKELEQLRLRYVAFPTKVVNMINGLFRQTRQGIEKNKTFVGGLIARRQEEKRQAYERELAAQQAKEAEGVRQEPIFQQNGEGVGRVQFETPAPEAPPNTVSSDKGAKVTMRSDLEVEVVDLRDFLKALVSKEQRGQWLSGEYEKLVTINMGPLKQLLKDNPTKRKVKGLKITKVQKAV